MLRAGVSVRCSSLRAHRALIAFSTCFPDSSLPVVPLAGLRMPPGPGAQDNQRAGRHRAVLGGEAPAGRPDVLQLAQGTLGRGAGTHPGRAAALGRRGQSRPR